MKTSDYVTDFEHKFCQLDAAVEIDEGASIEGYASYFGKCDQGGDVVMPGAYGAALNKLKAKGRSIKMLWQHDPSEPIGVWDEIREDTKGLYVKGRILKDVARGREAIALLEAGAIDGLSIGYRTVRSERNAKGQRLLSELELWEVSIVTFPMLPEARVGAKADDPADGVLRDLAAALRDARTRLAGP